MARRYGDLFCAQTTWGGLIQTASSASILRLSLWTVLVPSLQGTLSPSKSLSAWSAEPVRP